MYHAYVWLFLHVQLQLQLETIRKLQQLKSVHPKGLRAAPTRELSRRSLKAEARGTSKNSQIGGLTMVNGR